VYLSFKSPKLQKTENFYQKTTKHKPKSWTKVAYSKNWHFSSKFQLLWQSFLNFVKKNRKRLHILSRNMDIWVGFLKFAFLSTHLYDIEEIFTFCPLRGHFRQITCFETYVAVPNSIVEFYYLSKSGLWSKICQPHLEISQVFCRKQKRDFMEKSEKSKYENMKFFQHFLAKNDVKWLKLWFYIKKCNI
jgi:hypothetical protein